MLTGSDILQADSTVIAGVLILLTISSFSKTWKNTRLYWLRITPRQAVGFVVVPFSISAIILLAPVFSSAYDDASVIFSSTVFSVAGFVYLILVVIFVRTQHVPNSE